MKYLTLYVALAVAVVVLPVGLLIGDAIGTPEVITKTVTKERPTLSSLMAGDDTDLEKRLGPPIATDRLAQVATEAGTLPPLPFDIYSTADGEATDLVPGDTLILVTTIPTVPESRPANKPKPSKQEAL